MRTKNTIMCLMLKHIVIDHVSCSSSPFPLIIPFPTAHFDLQKCLLPESCCLHHPWSFDDYMISIDLGFEHFKGSSKRTQSFESSLSE